MSFPIDAPVVEIWRKRSTIFIVGVILLLTVVAGNVWGSHDRYNVIVAALFTLIASLAAIYASLRSGRVFARISPEGFYDDRIGSVIYWSDLDSVRIRRYIVGKDLVFKLARSSVDVYGWRMAGIISGPGQHVVPLTLTSSDFSDDAIVGIAKKYIAAAKTRRDPMGLNAHQLAE
jgi:hypothetical protein